MPVEAMAEPSVSLSHSQVRGRARLRVPNLYRADRLRRQVEQELSQLEGVLHASANSLTGSVLLVFNPEREAEEFVSYVKQIVKKVAARPVAEDAEVVSEKSPSLLSHFKSALRKTLTKSDSSESVKPKAFEKAAREVPEGRWHVFSADHVMSVWRTSGAEGLSEKVAEARLITIGRNLLPESQPPSALQVFIGQLANLPVILLIGSAALSAATGGVADAGIMLGVVVLNASIGFYTERQTTRAIRALSRIGSPDALVLRSGEPQKIPVADIVPGDILLLTAGDQIPADARLIETVQLLVDESALTGESTPVEKTELTLVGSRLPLADRVNMVYRGTAVAGGRGRAVVVATGAQTEIGKIQSSLTDAEQPQTPLQNQLGRLGNQLVILTSAVCGGVLVIGLLRRYSFLEMLKTSISLAVAAVPEGLPTVATTTLTLTVMKMRRRNMLVRKLDAVETLGAVQVVCLDKTGTLTRNQMSVVRGYTSGGVVSDASSSELEWLVRTIVLCNDSTVIRHNGTATWNGSATENALIRYALDHDFDPLAIRKAFPKLSTQYRAEGRNWMATSHEGPDGSTLTALKGSPEEVLSKCRFANVNGEVVPLNTRRREAILEENRNMGKRALRVLAGGYCFHKGDVPEKDFVFCGLVGMMDPPRPGVKSLIERFHKAGIATIMLTGDQAATAHAIAEELGLSGKAPLKVVDSGTLEDTAPEDFAKLVEGVHVFARVTPSHKLKIVQALQASGKVVAMTGDGINDGPALKASDVGIAMGAGGTEMAREVGDIVLKEDDLDTILSAVEEGRATYDNIRKSIHFILSTNISEVLVVLGAVAAGGGQPLNPMQLLWINLITDVFPALALSMESPEPDVLDRPPRDKNEPLFNRAHSGRIAREAAMMAGGALANYAYGRARYGAGTRAQGMAFSNVIASQLLHAYSCRSDHESVFMKRERPINRALVGSIGVGFALQGFALCVPGLKRLLGVGPLSLSDVLIGQASALGNFFINEAIAYRRATKANGSEQLNEEMIETEFWDANASQTRRSVLTSCIKGLL